MVFGVREAGCSREVAAIYSDHLRQVPLYHSIEPPSALLIYCILGLCVDGLCYTQCDIHVL